MSRWIPGLKIDLDEFQLEAVDFIGTKKRCLIADQGGLGKTITALAAYLDLKDKGLVKNLVIVAPASSIYATWQAECWQKTNIDPLIIEGSRAIKNRQYASGPRVLIVNYESFRQDYSKPAYSNADMIVFDESSYMKNIDSMTWQAANEISLKVKYLVMLSATPIENNVMDLYSAMMLIDPFILGSKPYFESKFCELELQTISLRGRVIKQWVIVGAKNVTELSRITAPYIMRRLPEDVGIKYADISFKEYSLDLTPSQRKVYLALKKGVLAHRDTLRTVELGAKFNYMLLACNSPSLVTKTPYIEGESAKIDFIKGMVSALKEKGLKVVIFSRWRMTIDLLERVLENAGFKVRTITGGVSKYARGKNVKEFTDSKDINVMLINLAGAKSLNLQAAHWLIFLDLYTNPMVNHQVILRLQRRTQMSNDIYVISFIMKGTVEDRVKRILEKKQAISSRFFMGLKLDREDMLKAIVEDSIRE